MKFVQGTLVLTLATLLTACGGGGSEGYFNNESNSSGNTTENTNTSSADTKFFEDNLKREGSILFGLLDTNNPDTPKGYIDHALDTFGNGVLELAISTHEKFTQNQSQFTYYDDCHKKDETSTDDLEQSEQIKQGCYVISGDNLKNLLGENYKNWNFNVNANDLKNMQPKEGLESYIGQPSVIIYENQNADKNLNSIAVTGSFGYPYQQSWGLAQSQQVRFVTIPNNDSSNGGFVLYNDPTSSEGKLYVVQADSSYSVLTNDNPNTPNIEPVTFTVHSAPGNEIATFLIKSNGTQILNLPNISAISGQRIENESPATNIKSITGSIRIEGDKVLNFLQSISGSTITYTHTLTLDADGKTITRTINGTTKK